MEDATAGERPESSARPTGRNESLSLLITSIEWERVNLTITLAFSTQPAGPVDFLIYDQLRAYPLPVETVSSAEYRITLNVTNFRDRMQIPDGSWRIMAVIGGARGPIASYTLTRAGELTLGSRTFLFNGNGSCYVVSFGLSEDDLADVVMRTYQLSRKRSPVPISNTSTPSVARPVTNVRRLLNQLDRSTAGLSGRLLQGLDARAGGQVTEGARKALQRIRTRRTAFPAVRRRRGADSGSAGRRPRVLFASEMRPRIGGNLLRIRDRMLERGLDSQFDLRYHFRTISMETTGDTRKLVAEFVAADIVLIDDYFPLLNAIDPRPETRVIQVWHAGSGFKSVGYSQFGGYESPGLTGAHRKYTFAIAGSTHLVPVYSEVFGIPPEAVIPTGLPRIDTFIDPERTEKLKAEFAASYPQFDGKTIILFAPTFRGGGASSAFYDYSQLDFARLHEACGDDSVILFRMHHFVPDAPPIPEEFADRLVDFSHFPDTNDLLHSVDVLVTDYSSIVYEYSLLNRPMLFFAYDKDLYSATRGFHRSYEETAPGRICTSIDELVDALETKDFEEWKIERFRAENFDYIDMHSADRVIDQLILNDPRSTPEAEAARALDAKRSRAALRFAAEQMVDDYPDSPVARRAVERLNEMANHKEGP